MSLLRIIIRGKFPPDHPLYYVSNDKIKDRGLARICFCASPWCLFTYFVQTSGSDSSPASASFGSSSSSSSSGSSSESPSDEWSSSSTISLACGR